MREKIVVVMFIMSLILMTACGKASDKVNSITGVVDEITSNYFYIEDEKGIYYQFALLDDNNIDISQYSVGDKITITYQGNLSETDTFYGKILNVEIVK